MYQGHFWQVRNLVLPQHNHSSLTQIEQIEQNDSADFMRSRSFFSEK